MNLFVRINLLLILLFCTILAFAQSKLPLANGLDSQSEKKDDDAIISIPSRDDWSAPEEIIGLQLGKPGSWDDFNPGAITPCTIVKLSGTYYLYYIGSDGIRE